MAHKSNRLQQNYTEVQMRQIGPGLGKDRYGSSASGWMRGVHVKMWDPLRTRSIGLPKRLRGVFTFTTRRYTNPRLPYLTLPGVGVSFKWETPTPTPHPCSTPTPSPSALSPLRWVLAAASLYLLNKLKCWLVTLEKEIIVVCWHVFCWHELCNAFLVMWL